MLGQQRRREKPTRPPETFRAVTAGLSHSCGLRTDNTITCWGNNYAGKADPPAGTFHAVTAGGRSCRAGYAPTTPSHAGGATPTGKPTRPPEHSTPSPPAGVIRAGYAPTTPSHAGGATTLRESRPARRNIPRRHRRLESFVRATHRQLAEPERASHAVGYAPTKPSHAGATFTLGQPPRPPDRTATSRRGSCMRAGCTETNNPLLGAQPLRESRPAEHSTPSPPAGVIRVGYAPSPARQLPGRTDPPAGTCGDGLAGYAPTTQSTAGGATPTGKPTRPPEHSTPSPHGGSHSCGLRTDNTITCWGNNDFEQAEPPAGTFHTVSAGTHHSCGLRTDDTIAAGATTTTGKPSRPPEHSAPSPPAGTTRAGYAPTTPSHAGATTTSSKPSRPPEHSAPSPPAGVIRAGYAPTTPSRAGPRNTTGKPSRRPEHSVPSPPAGVIRAGYAPTTPSNVGERS